MVPVNRAMQSIVAACTISNPRCFSTLFPRSRRIFPFRYFYYYCNFYYYLQAFEEIFGENLRKRQKFNFFYENINENIEKSHAVWYNEVTPVVFL